MAGTANIEYFILRYVPNAISDMSVSLAIIFIDPHDLQNGICAMRVADFWHREVQRIDQDCDLPVIEALLTEIRDRLFSKSDRFDMIRQLEDSFSNLVQVSDRGRCSPAFSLESVDDVACGLLSKVPGRSRCCSSMVAPESDSTVLMSTVVHKDASH
jgi:hypothetical protein